MVTRTLLTIVAVAGVLCVAAAVDSQTCSLPDLNVLRRDFKDVPVWLVTAEYPGLMGAGVALDQAAASRQL